MHSEFDIVKFVRKYWILILLFLLLLSFLPTLLIAWAIFTGKVVQAVGSILGNRAAQAVAKWLTNFSGLLEKHTWLVIAFVTLIFPPLGFLLSIWLLFDRWFRKGQTLTPVSSPSPTPSPSVGTGNSDSAADDSEISDYVAGLFGVGKDATDGADPEIASRFGVGKGLA